MTLTRGRLFCRLLRVDRRVVDRDPPALFDLFFRLSAAFWAGVPKILICFGLSFRLAELRRRDLDREVERRNFPRPVQRLGLATLTTFVVTAIG